MKNVRASEPLRLYGAFRGLRLLLALVFICASWSAGHAQDKNALQERRDAINRQIETTERLLVEAEANRSNALESLRLADERVQLREKLIRHHQSEIRSLERSMTSTDGEIRALEGHIEALKDEYARMVQSAYRMSLSRNPLLYIFAAADFTQAALRFQLMQSYSTLRKEQVHEITAAQDALSKNQIVLRSERNSMQEVLSDIQSERSRLERDRQKRATLVEALKGDEKQLRSEVQAAQKERDQLNIKIRRIIEAEIRAERESAAGEFALTPEGKIVSAAFERNKTSLPWPVLRGVVTGKYGRQAHPTLPGITTENNGIDITTDQKSRVLSVFDGTVSSLFPIPGAGQTLIISHGAYRTVYSHLERIDVTKGMVITAGHTLGIARQNGSNASVHFEVWNVSGAVQSPENPLLWLVKQ